MPAYRVDCSRAAAAEHGAKYLMAWSKLPLCPDCNRPMRPHGTPPSAWPATVVKATGGYCGTHSAERRAKGSLSGNRAEHAVPVPISVKKSLAEEWTPEQRSAAVLIADLALSADGPDLAARSCAETLEILGLLDENPVSVMTDLNDPKGVAANRY